jgi:hypothetical protein
MVMGLEWAGHFVFFFFWFLLVRCSALVIRSLEQLGRSCCDGFWVNIEWSVLAERDSLDIEVHLL